MVGKLHTCGTLSSGVIGGVTRIPSSYGGKQGQDPGSAVPYAVDADAYTMNLDSAFWVYNLVANLAYGERYNDVYPLIQEKIQQYQVGPCTPHSHQLSAAIQSKFFKETAELDRSAAALYTNKSQDKAVEMITKYCENTGNWMTKEWRHFWMYAYKCNAQTSPVNCLFIVTGSSLVAYVMVSPPFLVRRHSVSRVRPRTALQECCQILSKLVTLKLGMRGWCPTLKQLLTIECPKVQLLMNASYFAWIRSALNLWGLSSIQVITYSSLLSRIC